MKNIIFLGSLLLSLNFSFAQTARQNVERDFMNYSKLIAENKIEEALDYTNPKLYEVIRRQDVKNTMEAVFKMPEMEYKISKPIIKEVSDLKRIDSIDYVKIKFMSPIEMKFKMIDSSDKTTMRMIQNSLEQKFGKDNVIYDKASGFFKINADKEIVASSTDNHNNWKFVVVDNPKMKALLARVVPLEILE